MRGGARTSGSVLLAAMRGSDIRAGAPGCDAGAGLGYTGRRTGAAKMGPARRRCLPIDRARQRQSAGCCRVGLGGYRDVCGTALPVRARQGPPRLRPISAALVLRANITCAPLERPAPSATGVLSGLFVHANIICAPLERPGARSSEDAARGDAAARERCARSMLFRDENEASAGSGDPLARFMALGANRKWHQDNVPRRLAAVAGREGCRGGARVPRSHARGGALAVQGRGAEPGADPPGRAGLASLASPADASCCSTCRP